MTKEHTRRPPVIQSARITPYPWWLSRHLSPEAVATVEKAEGELIRFRFLSLMAQLGVL